MKRESTRKKNIQTTASNIVDKINDSYLTANYEADKMLQKVILIVKPREGAKISRLPAQWRKTCNSFSANNYNFLYTDERLVIPVSLRSSLMSSIHYGYPGRDTMLP